MIMTRHTTGGIASDQGVGNDNITIKNGVGRLISIFLAPKSEVLVIGGVLQVSFKRVDGFLGSALEGIPVDLPDNLHPVRFHILQNFLFFFRNLLEHIGFGILSGFLESLLLGRGEAIPPGFAYDQIQCFPTMPCQRHVNLTAFPKLVRIDNIKIVFLAVHHSLPKAGHQLAKGQTDGVCAQLLEKALGLLAGADGQIFYVFRNIYPSFRIRQLGKTVIP